MTYLLALVIVSQVADYLSTLYALRRGLVEKNPVARWAMEKLDPLGWCSLKLLVGFGVVVLSWPLLWPGLVAAGAGFWVTFLNIKRARASTPTT